MPYIEKIDREEINEMIQFLGYNMTVGELNYAITKILLNHLKSVDESYYAYNAIIGILECAKLEMYRKLISKYEDKKCSENGEVYPI